MTPNLTVDLCGGIGGWAVALRERRLRDPEGWHTSGPATARGLQVGNAIPPTLARVALDAALDVAPVDRCCPDCDEA